MASYLLKEVVSEEGLRMFAETCVLGPSLLARRLKLEDATIEQIQFGNPNDRYEQIYQMLLKWSQSRPEATWKDLQEATDSGVKRVLKDLYPEDEIAFDGGSDSEREEASGPVSKSARVNSPEPSAPPYNVVFPSEEEQTNHHHCLRLDSEADSTTSSTSKNGREERTSEGDDGVLTYDNDYSTVLEAIGHETHWFELGLALRLRPSLLDEIKETNRDRVADCRKTMIKEWLRNPKQSYKPTWRMLCSALKEEIVGNSALSNKIAKKYLKQSL